MWEMKSNAMPGDPGSCALRIKYTRESKEGEPGLVEGMNFRLTIPTEPEIKEMCKRIRSYGEHMLANIADRFSHQSVLGVIGEIVRPSAIERCGYTGRCVLTKNRNDRNGSLPTPPHPNRYAVSHNSLPSARDPPLTPSKP